MRDGYDSAQRFHASNILKLRYLGDPGDWRRYTPDEQAEDRRLGAVTLMILEDNGYMQSREQGKADGLKAARLMRELGRDPAKEVVFFTIDHGPPYNVPAVVDYMEGTRDAGIGNRGFYGPNTLGDMLVDQGHAEAFWGAGAWSWGTGYTNSSTPPPSKHAKGWQWPKYVTVGGVTTDYNTFNDNLDWISQTSTTEDEVTPQDIEAVAQRVAALLSDPSAPAGNKYLTQVADSVHYLISGEAKAQQQPGAQNGRATLDHIGEDAWFRVSGRAQIEASGRGEPVGTGNNKGWPTIATPQP